MESKICKICGEIFIPKVHNSLICSKIHYRNCVVCGNKFLIKSGNHRQLKRVMCPSCASKDSKKRMKETKLKMYGNKNYNNRSKAMKTCIERYNSKTPAENKLIREKASNTKLLKYGDSNYSNSIKCGYTKLKKYGNKKYNNYEKAIKTNLERYGVPHFCMTEKCINSQMITVSKINRNFSNFLNKMNINNEFEFKIGYFSYDIHILNSNILIEINPTYTHNSTYGPKYNKKIVSPKDKYYHYNKTKLALENNYICIHKFDWMTNNDILNIIENINDYMIIQNDPILHWYNKKKNNHIIDNNFNEEEMNAKGYVKIYDGGLRYGS